MIRVAKFVSLSVLVATALSMGAVASASAQGRPHKTGAHHTTRPLYDVAPQGGTSVNSDDPSLTGGGSAGYNQMIYNW